MPVRRTRFRTRKRQSLARDRWADMMCLFAQHKEKADGLCPFENEDAVREYWQAYREDLLAEWVERNPGSRPPAWWRFDAPAPLPEDQSQTVYLRLRRLLRPGELEAYRDRTAKWLEFVRFHQPTSTVAIGALTAELQQLAAMLGPAPLRDRPALRRPDDPPSGPVDVPEGL